MPVVHITVDHVTLSRSHMICYLYDVHMLLLILSNFVHPETHPSHVTTPPVATPHGREHQGDFSLDDGDAILSHCGHTWCPSIRSLAIYIRRVLPEKPSPPLYLES